MIKRIAITVAVIASVAGYGSAEVKSDRINNITAKELRGVVDQARQLPVPQAAKILPPSGGIMPLRPLHIDDSDSGKTVLVWVGDELRISLRNPGDGGYVLQNPVFDTTKLTFIGRVAIAPASPRPGDFGKVEFRFKGKAVGPTKVSIKSARGGAPGVEVFKVRIKVVPRELSQPLGN